MKALRCSFTGAAIRRFLLTPPGAETFSQTSSVKALLVARQKVARMQGGGSAISPPI